MMKKKIRWENGVLCLAFLILCCGLPLTGGLCFLAGYGQETGEENRTLAEFPVVHEISDIQGFPEKFEAWYTDHLFLKSLFVQWKSQLEIAVFHELDSNKVILGTKKPWLFYCSDDGQPLETYRRTNRFTERELEEIAENIEMLHTDLEDAGIRFILMIVPDKEQIYGEDYMPAKITISPGPSRTEQLIEYMAENTPQIPVVYPRDNLKAHRETYKGADSLYYESDTHWNQAGACLGMEELLGVITQQTGETMETGKGTFEKSGTRRGDLQKLASLNDTYDSQEYTLVPAPEYETTKVIRDNNDEVIWESGISRNPQCLPVSLYLTGDSFRWNAGAYLQEAAKESVVTSRYYFDTDDLVAREPDVFIYMIAERYLHELSVIPGYNTMALQIQ